MIELYGILQEQESINAELGLGVDYYKGEPGEQGIPGKDGKTPVKGVDYFTDAEITEIKDEIAEKVQVGAKGEDGKSAYQLAVEAGYEGSEADWLASLKGTDGRNGIDGINGTNGKDGKTPVKGVDYFTTAEINEIEEGAAAKVDLSNYAKTADLSTVATSGSYEDLTNKPTIPAAYELPIASATTLGGVKVGSGLDITNGVLSATGGGVADAVDWSKVQNKPNFADVATSGNYNDLSNKPTIPSVKGLASETYVNEKVAAIVIPEVPTKVSELENDKGYLTEHQSLEGYAKTADLAQVAKTGSYNDLIDKPTIPSTTGLATETYVDDKIAEIDIPTVPTKVSVFTNDAGYLTEHQSLIEYAKKTDIPAPYTLPTASTSTLGGVKVDGNTITIADGVISSVGGSGGSEPEKYIKDASVSGNTLTLTKKDDTEVVFTPSGGSGGDGSSYTLPAATKTTLGGIKVFTEQGTALDNSIGTAVYFDESDAEVAYVPLASVNLNHPGVVRVKTGNGLDYNERGVISMSPASTTYYGTVAYDGKTIQAKLNPSDQPTLYAATATASSLGVVMPDGTTTTVDANGILQAKIDNDTIIVKDGSMCVNKSQLSASNGLPTGGYYSQILVKNTSDNFDATWLDLSDALLQAGITAGGGSDWQYTQDQYDSNLYNAKELVVCVENTQGNKQMGYFYFGYTEGGSSTTLGQNWQNTNFYFNYDTSSPYISYNGTMLDCQNKNNLYFILYKT